MKYDDVRPTLLVINYLGLLYSLPFVMWFYNPILFSVWVMWLLSHAVLWIRRWF